MIGQPAVGVLHKPDVHRWAHWEVFWNLQAMEGQVTSKVMAARIFGTGQEVPANKRQKDLSN